MEGADGSYVQLQQDYILGNYPVASDDDVQLSALLILAESGFVVISDPCLEWIPLLKRFFPRKVGVTRSKSDWALDVLSRYKLMEHLSKDDARQQFIRIINDLPYGNSKFFDVRNIDDPIGLLPSWIILGINKRGVHFFRPDPKEYLHSAKSTEINGFGNNKTAVYIEMEVDSVSHKFCFETKQGKKIRVAIEALLEDAFGMSTKPSQSAPTISTQ